MKKTRELIKENLKAVDCVVEIIDSRIPVSSRNPIIDELIANKRRIIVLGKSDLADEAENRRWKEHFEAEADEKNIARVLVLNLQSGENIKQLLKALEAEQTRRNSVKSVARPLRLMIVGVPNVGKSSLINRLTGKRSAVTGDKPGVTRGKQWLTLDNGMQLLDTPGILWPKFEDPNVGLNLAFCGSIRDEILIRVIGETYPELLMERYKLDELAETPLENMDAIAIKRGFLMSGKRIDYERTGRTVVDEFRGGKIGRITLERL